MSRLTWDDHYPKTYTYKPSKEIEELRKRTKEYRRKKLDEHTKETLS